MPILPLFLTQEDYDKITGDIAHGKSLQAALGGELDSVQLWTDDMSEQASVMAARITDAESVNTTQEQVIAAMKQKDLAVEQFAIGINSDLQTQKNRIAALEKSDAAQSGEVAQIKSLNAAQDNRLSGLEQWKAGVDSLNAAREKRLGDIDAVNRAQNDTLKNVTDRAVSLEGVNTAQGQRLTALEQAPRPIDYQPQLDALVQSVDLLAQAIAKLTARVEALESPAIEEPTA